MLRFGLARSVVAVPVLAALAACGTSESGRPVLAEAPVPLVAGGTLVTPINSTLWDAGAREEPAPLAFADGQRASTRTIVRAPGGRPDPGEWLGSGEQRAQEWLLADIPAEALGQSVWMDGRRVPSFWILPSLTGPTRPRQIAEPLTPEQRGLALALVAPELADPRLRWRATLALERLGIDAPPMDQGFELAWAEQWATRADAALSRLHAADPSVCDRLLEALTRWVRTPQARVPIWPTDGDTLCDFVLALLRPGASDQAVIRTAQAYIDRQPQWLAWVSDDAGGVAGGRLVVVNLAPTSALLSTRPRVPGGGSWEASGMLEPGAMAIVPAPAGTARGAPTLWEVRLGGRTAILPVATNAIDLEPPGVAIGPFWNDWTLQGLQKGEARSPARGAEGWVGGLVHRDPRLDAASSTASGWVVYIEVRRPPCGLPTPGRPALTPDAVRIAFGPVDAPREFVLVRCSGLTTFDSAAGEHAGAEGALLTTAEDRWAFTLPIDRRWLEPDGTILLGAQWLPSEGPRATWPRPVLPGQRSIGRVRLDPSAWGLPTGGVSASRQAER